MEFNEKLQELRKQRGLTQEELSDILFVSRTAVSKWESGRGYPSIDSLKALSSFFNVSIDELLSGDELLTIADEEAKKKTDRIRDTVFGLLDVSSCLFFFLPFFGDKLDGEVRTVSLIALSGITPFFNILYVALVSVIFLFGVVTLAFRIKQGWRISVALNALGVFLFIISPQPYAAAFLFAFLAIKTLMVIKKQ